MCMYSQKDREDNDVVQSEKSDDDDDDEKTVIIYLILLPDMLLEIYLILFAVTSKAGYRSF